MTRPTRDRANTRRELLRAAEDVVLRDGVQNLRLETVAERAGVTKGGLFYHFPTKQDLIQGMVARYLDESFADLSRRTETLGGGLEAETLAVVQETAQADQRSNALAAALFAAIATDASLLAPVRNAMAERFQRLEANPDGFERLAVVNLAADALMLFDCLGITVGSPEGRRRILAALERMISAPNA